MLDRRFGLALFGTLLTLANSKSVQNSAGGLLRPFAGQDFTLQVAWAGMTLADRIRVLTSTVQCGRSGASGGSASLVAALSRPGIAGSSAATSSSQIWTGLAVTTVGSFKVCWCGPPRCTGDFDFNVQVGTFEAVGPAALTAKCTSTMSCTIQLTGAGTYSFSSVGGLLLLQAGTCGSSGATLSSWSGTTNPKKLTRGDILHKDGTVFHLTAFLTSSFLQVQQSHRICWSHSPSTNTDYKVDLGTLTFEPSAARIHPQCSLGDRCDFFLAGVGFAATNKILVSAAVTCGRVGKISYKGLTNPQQVQAPGKYVLGTARSGKAGVYNLCWAHNPPGGAVEYYFLLNVGSLTLCGPKGVYGVAGSTLTPIRSGPFVLEVHGICLTVQSRIRIIVKEKACGTINATSHTELLTGQLANTPDLAGLVGSTSNSTTSRVWQGLAVTSPGDLRVCWCQASSCISGSNFGVDAGEFTVRGPSSMRAVSLSGASDVFIAGTEFDVHLIGLGMISTDRIRIVSDVVNCGSSPTTSNAIALSKSSRLVLSGAGAAGTTSVVEKVTRWQRLRLDQALQFRVCWCGGECLAGSEFALDMGILNILGPQRVGQITCIVTASCSIHLLGTGFSSTNAIFVTSGSCGESAATAVRWVGITNPQGNPKITHGNNTPSSAVYFLGTAMTMPLGSVATVCWSSAPRVLASPLDYTVPVGTFVMHGPESAHPECELGVVCRVDVNFTSGDSLFASNDSTVRVVPLGGCSALTLSAFLGFTNPVPLEITSDPAIGTYVPGIASGGKVGIYDLCWRHGLSTGPGFALGTLSMHGPSNLSSGNSSRKLRPLMHATFGLRVIGLKMRPGSRVRIVDGRVHCGGHSSSLNTQHLAGSLPGVPFLPQNHSGGSEFSSLTWKNMSLSATGEYRVCWCAQSPCDIDALFNVDVGSFVVPLANVTDLPKAVAGETFCISLRGEQLLETDRIRLIDSRFPCGARSASVAGMLAGTPASIVSAAASTGYLSYLSWCSLQLNHKASLRACWCGDACNLTAGFVTDVGIVEVAGPQPAGVVSCIATVNCSVDLAGSRLLPQNGVLLVHSSSCGFAAGTASSRRGMPKEITTSAATYNLGSSLQLSHSSAMLCWASNPTVSSAPADYRVAVATVVIHGPQKGTLECYEEFPCVLELRGTSLGSSSSVSVANAGDGCTGNSNIFISHVITTATSSRSTLTSTPTSTFTTPTSTSTMTTSISMTTNNNRRLKVHSVINNNNNNSTNINSTRTIATTSTQSIATSFNTATTTIATSTTTNTTTPSIATTTFSTTTTSTTATSTSIAVETATYSFPARTLERSRTFTLCWRHHGSVGPRMAIGNAYVIGPVVVANGRGVKLQPYPKEAFTLEIIGLGLQTSNRVRIIDTSATKCGGAGSAAGSLHLKVASIDDSLTVGGVDGSSGKTSTSLRWPGLSLEAAGTFRVCWCQRGPCVQDHQFSTTVGEFLALGATGVVALSHNANASTNAILAGAPFTLELRGSTLTQQDRIHLVDAGTACNGSFTAAHTDALQEQLAGSCPNATLCRWPTVRLRRAASYRVCWCHAPMCQQRESFHHHIFVGLVNVLGPTVAHFTCVGTHPCSIRLHGSGLSNADEILFLAAGSCGTSRAVASKWTGFKNPQRARDSTAKSTSYFLGSAGAGATNISSQICWRGAAATGFDGMSRYVVHVGSFTLHGPMREVAVECAVGGLQCGAQLQVSSGIETGSLLLASMPCSSVESSWYQNKNIAVTITGLANPQRATNTVAGLQTFAFGFISGKHWWGPSQVFWLCWTDVPTGMLIPSVSAHTWSAGKITIKAGKFSRTSTTTDTATTSTAAVSTSTTSTMPTTLTTTPTTTTASAATTTLSATLSTAVPCTTKLDISLKRGRASCRNHSEGDRCNAPCSSGFEGGDYVRCLNGKWLVDGNGSHCLEDGAKNVAPQVVVTVTLANVSYQLLSANSSLMNSCKTSAVKVIVLKIGGGIAAEHVKVEVFPGSIIVKATITLPEFVATGLVHSKLLGASPSELGKDLVAGVSKIKGFNLVTTGEVRASGISVAVLTSSSTSGPSLRGGVDGHQDSEGGDVGGIVAGVLVTLFALGLLVGCGWKVLRGNGKIAGIKIPTSCGCRGWKSSRTLKAESKLASETQNESELDTEATHTPKQIDEEEVGEFIDTSPLPSPKNKSFDVAQGLSELVALNAKRSGSAPSPTFDVAAGLSELTALNARKNSERSEGGEAAKLIDREVVIESGPHQMLVEEPGGRAVMEQTLLPDYSTPADEPNILKQVSVALDDSPTHLPTRSASAASNGTSSVPKGLIGAGAMDELILATLLATVEEDADSDWGFEDEGECAFVEDDFEDQQFGVTFNDNGLPPAEQNWI